MKKYHVYGIGAALVDTEIEVSDEALQKAGVDKGLMTLVDEERQSQICASVDEAMSGAKRASGGSAANSIIAVSAFGGNTYYSCKVANDQDGLFYLKDLHMAGVDTSSSSLSKEGTTGTCLVMITPDAERSMNTYLGISATLSENEINLDAIEQSQYLYFEGYLVTSDTGRAAAIKARKHAEKHGVKTAISLSDPGMVEFFTGGLKEMIGDKVDLLFCNKDEAMGWANTDNVDDALEELKKASHQIAITLGDDGALIFDGKETHVIEAHDITAIDSNGAGDMFAGALLYGITHDMPLPQAGQLACRAAAEVVSRFGPRLPLELHTSLLKQL